MQNWLLEIIEIVIAVLVMGFIFFRLAFSGKEDARRQAAVNGHRGFERRDAEQRDRRRSDLGPPPGSSDRRVNRRR